MRSGFSSFSNAARTSISVVVLVSGFAGCSPDVVQRSFTEPKRDFGPLRSDGDIPGDGIQLSLTPTAASIRWRGDIETAKWNRAAEDLGWLSRKLAIPQIGKLALQMRRVVANSIVSSSNTFANSAYTSAAIGETRDDTKKSVDQAVQMLRAQGPVLEELLFRRNSLHEWPTSRVSLVVVVDHVGQFLSEFVRDVEKSAVDKTVRKQIVEELRINFGPRVQRIRSGVALAYNEKKTYAFVAKVRAVLKSEDVALATDIEAQLNSAERLTKEVERISDARSALSVLVDFWVAASPATRISKFQKLAPDLFDFFNDQSAEDLQCVKVGCGFLMRIKRALFILPEIEKYGIDKLRTQLTTAAEETIRSELETQAVKFLPGLYKEILTQISQELIRQTSNISKISTDYGTYLRLVLNRVAIAKLALKEKDPVAGIEPNLIRVEMQFSNKATLQAQPVPSQSLRGFQTGASAIGSGLAAAVELHDYHIENILTQAGSSPNRVKQALGRVFFEQINKVLLIGGFKTETAKPFEALSVAIDGERMRDGSRRRFNLRTLLSSETSFAVPDTVAVAKSGKANSNVGSSVAGDFAVSVAGQADVLRGLSRLAMALRDWEVTSFDRVLGPINLADFVTDLPRETVDQKLFPKDLFFAASIGNAGAILQNMAKSSTMVGLIGQSREMHWANEPDPQKDPAKQALKATMFDIVNGQRVNVSKTRDVARFLSAVVEFLRASDGVEKTQSSILITADEKGHRPIDQLRTARQDLKLLVMALGNFLANESLDARGVVLPVFTRTTENVAVGMSGDAQLEDQALVIRALLDAAEINDAAIHRNAALDLFAATNETFFRPELGFYSSRADQAADLDLEAMSAMLIAGERLKPYMKRERSAQWIRASRPWINALRDAAESLP